MFSCWVAEGPEGWRVRPTEAVASSGRDGGGGGWPGSATLPRGSAPRRLLAGPCAARPALRPRSGCGRLGQGEEAEEALYRLLAALDLQVSGAPVELGLCDAHWERP